MQPRADIAVHSPEGELELVVEVKGVPKTDATWAAHYRRNLLAHRFIPLSPYFLLFAPDSVYLWLSGENDGTELPAVTCSTKAILARYLPRRDALMSAPGLEMAVQSWLLDLASLPSLTALEGDEKRLLADSGLFDKIRAGLLTLDTTP